MNRNGSGWGFIIFFAICIIVAVFLLVTMCSSVLGNGECEIAGSKVTGGSVYFPERTI